MSPDPRRLSDVVRARAVMHPDRVALQDATGSRFVTYGELWSRVELGAAALQQRDLAPGDRVLIALPSGTDWMPAFLAVVHAGLVAVPIPVEAPGTLARLAATFTGARAWIGGPQNDERAAALGAPAADRAVGSLVTPIAPLVPPMPLMKDRETSPPRPCSCSHRAARRGRARSR